jgi:hypothetical protein
MKERPILFSGEMVRAILAGKKTQTRRVVKLDVSNFFDPPNCQDDKDAGWPITTTREGDTVKAATLCPHGQPGDRLWVRETWGHNGCGNCPIHYRADEPEWKNESLNPNAKWHPSIFMPRCASRILLEITAVRCERLQEITREDASAEGVVSFDELSTVDRYAILWESINGKTPGKRWEDNPWVWVIEFRRIEP